MILHWKIYSLIQDNSRHVPSFIQLQHWCHKYPLTHPKELNPRKGFPCFSAGLSSKSRKITINRWVRVSAFFTIRIRQVEQTPKIDWFSVKIQSLNPMEVYKRWVRRNKEYVHSLESLANVSILDKPFLCPLFVFVTLLCLLVWFVCFWFKVTGIWI